MADDLDPRVLRAINKAKSRRDNCVKSIFSLKALVEKAQSEKELWPTVKAMYSDLADMFNQFKGYVETIDDLYIDNDQDLDPSDQEVIITVRAAYYFIIGAVQELIPPKPPPPASLSSPISPPVNSSNVYLPKITLPMFDGNPISFKPFFDSFSSLVHNDPGLSNIQKFIYLRGSVTGSAASAIKLLPLTEANYNIAWQTLVDQYEDSQAVAVHYLNNLIEFPPMQTESSQGLENFLQVFSEYTTAFQQMTIPDKTGFLMYYLASRVLDSKTRKQFSLENQTEFPTIKQLLDFVRKYQRAVKNSTKGKPMPLANSLVKKPTQQYPLKVKSSFVITQPKISCPCCKKLHKLYECEKFKSLPPYRRNGVVKSAHSCFNCLSATHGVSECPSNSLCRVCNNKHHTLLCFKSTQTSSDGTAQADVYSGAPASEQNVNNLSAVSCAVSHVSRPSSYVFLGTAVVDVYNYSGDLVKVRALIDCASQATFVTESCVKRLGLRMKSHSVSCVALGATAVRSHGGTVQLTFHCRDRRNSPLVAQAIVIPRITASQPSISVSNSLQQHYAAFDLADPEFTQPGAIDVLLGADLFSQVFTGKCETPLPGLPSAWSTVFGYIILGQYATQCVERPVQTCTSLVSVKSNSEVNQLLQQFWELEEIPSAPVDSLSPEEILAEDMFTTLHYREPNGRYVVPLLVKPDEISKLGSSFNIASMRLNSLKRKFVKNPQLKIDYCAFMQEYKDLCHMTEVPLHSGTCYIPHHPVLRSDTRGLKLRVVFNATSPTSSGDSLNSILLKGPKLQKPIDQVVTRFRLFPIAVVCDIKHNFRMIKIRPCDRKFLHILWSPDNSTPMGEFELDTVTYGTSSAPYLALRTTEQGRRDEGHRFPLANAILVNQIFVDDVLGGAKTLEEARQLIDELTQLMKSCGFTLHKWATNVQSGLFDSTPSSIALDSESSATIKVLGLQWCPVSDEFCYTVNLSPSANTKRAVLSNIARVFDPLGWIGPVSVWAKQFLQKLWRLGLDWDTPLPEQEYSEWQKFVSSLKLVSQFRVPRIVLSPDTVECSLIGFCDASEKGYAAVVYLRSQCLSYSGSSHLLMAKTKVAPVKPLTIPRLELLGAVHLMKLVNHVHEALCTSVTISNVITFTDSSVVLSWLRTEPHKLQTFVCHRVVSILSSPVPLVWKHVSSLDNPADVASKGCLPAQLLQDPLWLHGPIWLTSSIGEWPTSQEVTLSDVPELKVTTLVATTQQVSFDIEDHLSTCSDFSKLQRSIAYWLRYMRNLTSPKKVGQLYIGELHQATLALVKMTQQKYFAQDIKAIRKGKECSAQLKSLTPFLDPQGILLVGGRLQNSDLSFYAQHPMILPKSSVVTQLLVQHYHHLFLHVGANTLNYLLRSKFWILSARTAIRSVLHKCLVCRKLSASPTTPQMGNLPPFRVNITRPFLHCGIDFGGPFMIKESKRRNSKISKAYLCLFICLAVKAIHLEIVSDLTTDAFLAALDRFTARRGLCSDIYTDGGRNFVGANRQLKEVFSLVQTEKTLGKLSDRSITWHFNPPMSPNFGGLWEAGIKSAKGHLKRVIGDRPLTFEELSTVFSRIEAVLNSRPLVDVPATPSDSPVLSPAHFLVGSSLCLPPETNLLDTNPNLLKRWQLFQKIRQDFSKRWVREYLNTLQQRHKWPTLTENVSVGDVVWVKGDNLTPLEWPLARVEEVHPGHDSIVRVVTLRTAHGTYTRPVSKLIKLPLG